jgi:cytochrome P450
MISAGLPTLTVSQGINMQVVSEMSLPTLPVHEASFTANPMPYVEEARLQHPWLAKFKDGYIVHGYQATKDLIYMDDKLRPARDGIVQIYGAQGTPWGRFMGKMLLAQRGEEHARIRGSAGSSFTPRNVNKHRPLMRSIISQLLDEWAPRGAFDFADFAAEFPVKVLCGLLGVSADGIPAVRKALETQAASLTLNPDLLPALLAGYDVLWNFADKIVADREKSGATTDGSLLDEMISAKTKGTISEEELRYLLMVLFPAGYDTSKNMLTLTMHMMLTRPNEWARCAEDRAFSGRIVDEMLRHSAITTPYRLVGEEFDYDNIRFTKGTLLVFATALSGRDPTAFQDPMEFRADRVNTNRHVAFGRGEHICIGQHLARTQLEESVHLIAQRITHPKLAGAVTWRPFLGVWGLRTLPITFEPAPARPDEPGAGAAETAARSCPIWKPA